MTESHKPRSRQIPDAEAILMIISLPVVRIELR